MVRIKPFRAVRPPKEHASEVASRPYDVLNSAEAKAEATERSLLHIIKPEIDFDPIADEHSQPVYDKAVENFRRWQSEGWLRQDPEEYCYFLAVTVPAGQLRIIDYNRVVKDLNGLTPAELLEKLNESFVVEDKGTEEYRPAALHNFSMYLDGRWYSLAARPGTYDDNDPIGVLDVTVLSNLVLDRILDIKDLRTSKRIDFVGGIRGLGELKRRVDSGEMKAAFALYPVSMQQLINIADTGNIMPPKTTWFEPKLRSGVVIHSFDEK